MSSKLQSIKFSTKLRGSIYPDPIDEDIKLMTGSDTRLLEETNINLEFEVDFNITLFAAKTESSYPRTTNFLKNLKKIDDRFFCFDR